MAKPSHIHVRPLEIADFVFVQELASKQPNFTIPSTYVLWLLLRIKGAVCLIAETPEEGPIAYLLAVPVEAPTESLFVWQMASIAKVRKQGSLSLLKVLKDLAHERKVETISFSAEPQSAAYRLIRQYTNKLVARVPQLSFALPFVVAPRESEYRVNLH